jgi:hypothetical protein
MKLKTIFTTCLLGAFFTCNPSSLSARTEHTPMVRDAVARLSTLAEFAALYENRVFNLEKEFGQWRIVGRVLLTPYWELRVVVPVLEPTWKSPLSQAGITEISLHAIENIEIHPRTREFKVTYGVAPITINLQEWVKLVRAKGQLREIGIKLQTAERVRHLEDYFEYLQRRKDY